MLLKHLKLSVSYNSIIEDVTVILLVQVLKISNCNERYIKSYYMNQMITEMGQAVTIVSLQRKILDKILRKRNRGNINKLSDKYVLR